MTTLEAAAATEIGAPSRGTGLIADRTGWAGESGREGGGPGGGCGGAETSRNYAAAARARVHRVLATYRGDRIGRAAAGIRHVCPRAVRTCRFLPDLKKAVERISQQIS